jgi:hypothetical protein
MAVFPTLAFEVLALGTRRFAEDNSRLNVGSTFTGVGGSFSKRWRQEQLPHIHGSSRQDNQF